MAADRPVLLTELVDYRRGERFGGGRGSEVVGGGGGDEGEQESGQGDTGGGLSGRISIEGSSTMQPITQGVVETFTGENPDVEIFVGGSGTGDRFEAFCRDETQISDASRPIEAREALACDQNGVEFMRCLWRWTASRSS